MKEKVKSFFSKIGPYAVPGLITMVAVLIALICKGIWPFGSNRIDYFDNMQQVAPLYTHVWDWIHGKASIWFDWYTGLGTNVSMSVSAFSMLSPFNILLYLIPRHLILESISILTVVKMVFMSIAMYVFLNRKYKNLQYSMKVLFSVMYSLCGYVLMYGSCFTPWMDIVAFFPILMIAYDIMMQKGKKIFYIFMVGLCFTINYYLSAMSLIYIFLISGAYMLIVCGKKKWKEHAWNLGIGTVAGVGLSSFVLIPVFMQLMNSQRGSSSEGILDRYKGWITGAIVNDGQMAAYQRWMMLYGLAFVIAIICIGLRKYRDDKKRTAYNGVLIAMVVVSIVVEGTNLIWHFGSYNGYTLRNGFILIFTLIMVAADYAKDMLADIKTDRKKFIRPVCIAGAICVAYIVANNLLPGGNELTAIAFFMTILVVMFIVYMRKMIKGKQNFNCKMVIPMVAVELFIGTYSLIGPPKFYTYEDYQIGDYVQLANKVYSDLDIKDSATDRIINPDISLNANYPLILRRGALSSFTAALLSDTQSYAKNWGYSKYFLWLLDSGGTVFTNAMFHITEAVNQNDLDPVMYTEKEHAGDYTLYSANYTMPFATCVGSSFAGEDLGSDWVTMHNAMYKALTDDTQNLVTGMPYTSKKTDKTLQYTVRVDGNSALYMSIKDINNRDNDANCSWLMNSMKIYANDRLITIPTLGNVKNTQYFTDYNNNLVYLGCFKDETVNIRVEYDDPWYLNVSEVSIGSLNMDKMAALCDKYKDAKCEVSYTNDSLTVKVNGTATKNLALIPIINSDNWKVTVNGEKAAKTSIGGLFTGVTVHPGENTIVMKFEAKGCKEGLLISAAVLFMILMCVIIDHFRKIKVPAFLKYCAVFVYLQLLNIVVLVMFLIPALAAIPAFIYQIIHKIIG